MKPLLRLAASALLFAGASLAAEPESPVVISHPVEYRITTTTTFVVPAKNTGIDQLKVSHAYPTARVWNKAAGQYSAKDTKFTPSGTRHAQNPLNKDYSEQWTVAKRLKPGTKLTFRSEMTVLSAERDLDMTRYKPEWKDFKKSYSDRTAVIDKALLKNLPEKITAIAKELKQQPPLAAIEGASRWVSETIRFDPAAPQLPEDIVETLNSHAGHAAHQIPVFRRVLAEMGIVSRPVAGLVLHTPDGDSAGQRKIRPDFSNIGAWVEIYLPGQGWIEASPSAAEHPFRMESRAIQANRSFQSYQILMREDGVEKYPPWRNGDGVFLSDYGVENIITFTQKELPETPAKTEPGR